MPATTKYLQINPAAPKTQSQQKLQPITYAPAQASEIIMDKTFVKPVASNPFGKIYTTGVVTGQNSIY